MMVYDNNGNLLETFNPSTGRLTYHPQLIEHPEIPAVDEEFHWDVRQYDNGSTSRRKIVTRAAAPAVPAWTETIEAYVFVPFTDEEIAELEKPSAEERIAELEAALTALLEGVTE